MSNISTGVNEYYRSVLFTLEVRLVVWRLKAGPVFGVISEVSVSIQSPII